MVVIVGGCAAAATAMLNAFVAVLFAASVTCTVNDTVPAVVGVPEITPSMRPKLNPAGKAPALIDQVYGSCATTRLQRCRVRCAGGAARQ